MAFARLLDERMTIELQRDTHSSQMNSPLGPDTNMPTSFCGFLQNEHSLLERPLSIADLLLLPRFMVSRLFQGFLSLMPA